MKSSCRFHDWSNFPLDECTYCQFQEITLLHEKIKKLYKELDLYWDSEDSNKIVLKIKELFSNIIEDK